MWSSPGFTADPASWAFSGHGVIGAGVGFGAHVDTLCEALSAAGASWGDDDVGRAFFNGDGSAAPGYGTSRDQALAALADIVNSLQVIGVLMVAVANNYMSAEEASTVLGASIGLGQSVGGAPAVCGVPEISWYRLKQLDCLQVESDPAPSAFKWMFNLFSSLSLGVQIPDGSIAGLGRIRDAFSGTARHISREVVPDVEGFTRRVASANNGGAADGFTSFVRSLLDELSWLEQVCAALADSADSARRQKIAMWIQAGLSAAYLLMLFVTAQVMAVWSGPAAELGFWEAVRGEARSLAALYRWCCENVLVKSTAVGALFGVGMEAARQGGLILAGLQPGFDVGALVKATERSAFAGALMGGAGIGIQRAASRGWPMFAQLAGVMSRSGMLGRASRFGINTGVGTLANAGSEWLFDGRVDWGQAALDGAGMAFIGEAAEPVKGAIAERIRGTFGGTPHFADGAAVTESTASGRDLAGLPPTDVVAEPALVGQAATDHILATVGYHETMAAHHDALASEAFGRLQDRAAPAVAGLQAHTPDAYHDGNYADNADQARYHREQAELWRQRLPDTASLPAIPSSVREPRMFGFVHHGVDESGRAVTYIDVVGEEHVHAMEAYHLFAQAAGAPLPFEKIDVGHYAMGQEDPRGFVPNSPEGLRLGVLHTALGYVGSHDGVVPLLDGANDPSVVVPRLNSEYADWFARPTNRGLTFAANPLTPQDFHEIRGRFEAAAPALERMGLGDWHERALQRIDAMTRNAWGERARDIREARTENGLGDPVPGRSLLELRPDNIRKSLADTLEIEDPSTGLKTVIADLNVDRYRTNLNVRLNIWDSSMDHVGSVEFDAHFDPGDIRPLVADISAVYVGGGRTDPAAIAFGREVLTRVENWLIAHDVERLTMTHGVLSGYSTSAPTWDGGFHLDVDSRQRIQDNVETLRAAGEIAPTSAAAWARIQHTNFRASDVIKIGYTDRQTDSGGMATWDGLKMLNAFPSEHPGRLRLWKRLVPAEFEPAAARGSALVDPETVRTVAELTNSQVNTDFNAYVEQLARISTPGDSVPTAADLVRMHHLTCALGFHIDHYNNPTELPYPDLVADRVRRLLGMTEMPKQPEIDALGWLVDGTGNRGWPRPGLSNTRSDGTWDAAAVSARLETEAATFLHREPGPQALREILRPEQIGAYKHAHGEGKVQSSDPNRAIAQTLPTERGIGDPESFLHRVIRGNVYQESIAPEWLRSTIGFQHSSTRINAEVADVRFDRVNHALHLRVEFSRGSGAAIGGAEIDVRSTDRRSDPLTVEIMHYRNDGGPAFGRDFLLRVENLLIGQGVFKVGLVVDGDRGRPVRGELLDAAEAGFVFGDPHRDLPEMISYARQRLQTMSAAGDLGRAGESDWARLEPRTNPSVVRTWLKSRKRFSSMPVRPPGLGELYAVGRVEAANGPDGEPTWPGKQIIAGFPGFRHNVRLTARLSYPD